MQKSFVRYIGLRFKKARFHSWAKKRYIDAENRAEEYVRLKYSKMKDLNTMSTEEFDSIQNEFKFEPHYYLIMQMLNEFTLAEPNFETINSTASLLNGIANIIYDDNSFVFDAEGLTFIAKKLTHEFPELKRYLTDIENRTRVKKCHPYSVVLANFLEINNSDNACKISLVTDRIYQLSHKAKFLHSWVEVEIDGNCYVLDSTKNLIIDRDAYYEICHVQQPEKVDSKQLLKDYKLIRKLTDYDEYLVKVYYENAENGRVLYDTLVERGEIIEK